MHVCVCGCVPLEQINQVINGRYYIHIKYIWFAFRLTVHTAYKNIQVLIPHFFLVPCWKQMFLYSTREFVTTKLNWNYAIKMCCKCMCTIIIKSIKTQINQNFVKVHIEHITKDTYWNSPLLLLLSTLASIQVHSSRMRAKMVQYVYLLNHKISG